MSVTLLAVGGLAVGVEGTAGANNFSGASGSLANCALNNPGSINMADAQPHTYWYSASVANNHSLKIHQDWAWNSVYGPTSVNPQGMASPTTATDVVFYAQDYTTYCGRAWHPQQNGPATAGLATCVSLNPGASTCEKHEVRYDLSWWNGVDDGRHRKISCHEIGHTLGLIHPEEASDAEPNSCMPQGNSTIDYISWHDLMHLNGGSWMLRGDGSLHLPSTIYEGQAMKSPNGGYALFMQGDGNLVLYNSAWSAQWANGMNNPYGNWLVMQSDGNLVQYASDGWGTWPVWSTGTNGPICAGGWFKLQDDGNMVLTAPGEVAKWTRFAGRTGGPC